MAGSLPTPANMLIPCFVGVELELGLELGRVGLEARVGMRVGIEITIS